MGQVYLVNEDKTSLKLNRVHCNSEQEEVQDLLQKNFKLLLGDQIDPDLPRQWMLIKREIPIVNPANGEGCYYLDFLLVDQLGVPTLVECKRCLNGQSRREVVGQMLEYAANGRHYWTQAELTDHAMKTWGDSELLNAQLQELTGDREETSDSFFPKVIENLSKSAMRLIFFLDESPLELRSIVEFLNAQLGATEVLIIEARQYKFLDALIVVPWLFGFTEAARVAKKESRERTAKPAPGKGPDEFWKAFSINSLSDSDRSKIRSLVSSASIEDGCEIKYQTSCMLTFPALKQRANLIRIRRSGLLELYVKPMEEIAGSEAEVFEHFKTKVGLLLGATFAPDQQYREFSPEQWMSKITEMWSLISQMALFANDRGASSIKEWPI